MQVLLLRRVDAAVVDQSDASTLRRAICISKMHKRTDWRGEAKHAWQLRGEGAVRA
jgi:hypothetical protein